MPVLPTLKIVLVFEKLELMVPLYPPRIKSPPSLLKVNLSAWVAFVPSYLIVYTCALVVSGIAEEVAEPPAALTFQYPPLSCRLNPSPSVSSRV